MAQRPQHRKYPPQSHARGGEGGGGVPGRRPRRAVKDGAHHRTRGAPGVALHWAWGRKRGTEGPWSPPPPLPNGGWACGQMCGVGGSWGGGGGRGGSWRCGPPAFPWSEGRARRVCAGPGGLGAGGGGATALEPPDVPSTSAMQQRPLVSFPRLRSPVVGVPGLC